MYYRTFFVALDQTILGVIMEIRTKILTLTHDLSKSLLVIIGTDCEVYSSGVLSKYMRAYLRAVCLPSVYYLFRYQNEFTNTA